MHRIQSRRWSCSGVTLCIIFCTTAQLVLVRVGSGHQRLPHRSAQLLCADVGQQLPALNGCSSTRTDTALLPCTLHGTAQHAAVRRGQEVAHDA